MADRRFIKTTIWRDEYVRNLTHEEFRIYIYLRTNESITYYGVMDLNYDMIAAVCNIEVELARNIMAKFVEDNKVLIKGLQVFIRGFIKMNSPKGVNKITKEKLERDAYKLNRYICKAVLEECFPSTEVAQISSLS